MIHIYRFTSQFKLRNVFQSNYRKYYEFSIMLCMNMHHPNGPKADLEDEESEREAECCRLFTKNKTIMLLFLIVSKFPCCQGTEHLKINIFVLTHILFW